MASKKLAFLIVAFVTAAALPALAQGGGGAGGAAGGAGGASAGAGSAAGGASTGGGSANSGSATGSTANGATTGINSQVNSKPPQRLHRQARQLRRKRIEMPARVLPLMGSRSGPLAQVSGLPNTRSDHPLDNKISPPVRRRFLTSRRGNSAAFIWAPRLSLAWNFASE